VSAERGLEGEQIGTLVDALIDAYTPEELDILLYVKLSRSFSGIATGGSFKVRVFNLVRTARREGWLPDLVIYAGKERPGNTRMKDWITANGHVVGAAVAPQFDDIIARYESMNFDLIELRKIVLRAIKYPVNPVIGLVVRYPDDVFITKLCGWLESNLSNAKRKDALNLYSDFGSVSDRIRAVTRYRRDLDTADVLCKVYAQGVSMAVVAEFWRDVQREFAQISRRLVLVFACDSLVDLPAGMVELPPPRFEVTDLDIWTRDIVLLCGWPVELADEWTDLLCDEAMNEDVLDIRSLYETMDDHIREMRYQPHVFRQRLEGRTGHANAPRS
jgi:Effector-associated domain 1